MFNIICHKQMSYERGACGQMLLYCCPTKPPPKLQKAPTRRARKPSNPDGIPSASAIATPNVTAGHTTKRSDQVQRTIRIQEPHRTEVAAKISRYRCSSAMKARDATHHEPPHQRARHTAKGMLAEDYDATRLRNSERHRCTYR